MRTTSIALLLALLVGLLLYPTCSATEGGTLCVIPNSEKPPTIISPGDAYNPSTLLLKIDKRLAIHWPHKEIVKINGLDLRESHLVVLYSDGKRIKSFRFRFADVTAANHVCITFDGYQGVGLLDANSANCKCK